MIEWYLPPSPVVYLEIFTCWKIQDKKKRSLFDDKLTPRSSAPRCDHHFGGVALVTRCQPFLVPLYPHFIPLNRFYYQVAKLETRTSSKEVLVCMKNFKRELNWRLEGSHSMGEPLSIFAGVLAIATAAIQSSVFLIEIANGIKSSSKEIQAISRDAQSIYSTISSLEATLKNGKIKAGTMDDDAILEIIKSLTAPLSNCKMVLEELVVKIRKLFKLTTKDVGDRTGVMNLKWALYKKNEIRDVQLRLEAAKSTLNTALSGFSV